MSTWLNSLNVHPTARLKYVLVMQRFREVYRGISHKSLVFSSQNLRSFDNHLWNGLFCWSEILRNQSANIVTRPFRMLHSPRTRNHMGKSGINKYVESKTNPNVIKFDTMLSRRRLGYSFCFRHIAHLLEFFYNEPAMSSLKQLDKGENSWCV